jgi:predicted ArsR family transcriptional regulator
VAERLEDEVSSIALLDDPVRRSLYQFVAGRPEPVSRGEAAEAVGVQRTLAAFHLDKLADEGLLDVEFRRLSGRSGPGAGRPAKLYRRSTREIEVSLPPRSYDVAARLLASAIHRSEGGDTEVRESLDVVAFELGRRLGQEAARRLPSRASVTSRREAMMDVLREQGFEPSVVDGEVVLANCPFHSLARQFTDLVCGMNLHLMKGLRSAASLRPNSLEPRLDPQPGFCCVRFGRT